MCGCVSDSKTGTKKKVITTILRVWVTVQTTVPLCEAEQIIRKDITSDGEGTRKMLRATRE